jgi:hypothetical protein
MLCEGEGVGIPEMRGKIKHLIQKKVKFFMENFIYSLK